MIKFAKTQNFSIISCEFYSLSVIMTQTQDPIQLDQQAVVNPQVPLDSQQVPGIQPEVVASPEVVVPNAAVPVQPSVSPGAVAPDQGFLDSMITKGVQGIASLTGSPDPQT